MHLLFVLLYISGFANVKDAGYDDKPKSLKSTKIIQGLVSIMMSRDSPQNLEHSNYDAESAIQSEGFREESAFFFKSSIIC